MQKLTLRTWRIAKEMTLTSAASACGVHENTLRNWEKDEGNMPFRAVVKLIKLYGITFDDIFLP